LLFKCSDNVLRGREIRQREVLVKKDVVAVSVLASSHKGFFQDRLPLLRGFGSRRHKGFVNFARTIGTEPLIKSWLSNLVIGYHREVAVRINLLETLLKNIGRKMGLAHARDADRNVHVNVAVLIFRLLMLLLLDCRGSFGLRFRFRLETVGV